MILKELKVQSDFENIITNCYIVEDENTKETIVIDPGGEPEKILELLNILESNVKYIYLTHCHGDHIGAVKEIQNKKGGKILIHSYDYEGLKDPKINLTEIVSENAKSIEADSRVNDGDFLHLGDLEFKVIHTPGHTKGGSSLYCKQESLIFSGDTMLKNSWGRTDLPTGNFKEIIDSITDKLLVLPKDTIVYPGHGISTKILEEEPIYLDLMPGDE